MVGWTRCLPDTWFEIRTLVVWGRARYLSATEAAHNIESLQDQSGVWTRDLRLSKQADLTTAPGPPPYHERDVHGLPKTFYDKIYEERSKIVPWF